MRMLRKCVSGMIVGLLALGFAVTVQAIPNLISYQGVLNDQNGLPVTGTVNITFRIYDMDTGGVALWNENQSVQVETGLFNVKLGAVQQLPASVFVSDSLYLGTQIGADGEMTPRQRITPGPYLQSVVPIGTIMAWAKDLTGIPALADSWVECNGQTLSDSESPLDGQVIPNLNGGNRYLRGGITQGSFGGAQNHSHYSGMDIFRSPISGDYNIYFTTPGFDATNTRLNGPFEFTTPRDSTGSYLRWGGRNSLSADNYLDFVDRHKTYSESSEPPYYQVTWIIRIK